MSMIITKSDGKSYCTEGYIDHSSEISSISASEFNPGDTLVALDDAKVFVLNKEGSWIELGGES